jgi:hypothetical protein
MTKLISWASEQHPKSNGSAAKLKNKQQTITTCWQQGASWQITDLAPKKGGKAKKPPVNKHSEKQTPKQDSWWSWSPEPEDSMQT